MTNLSRVLGTLRAFARSKYLLAGVLAGANLWPAMAHPAFVPDGYGPVVGTASALLSFWLGSTLLRAILWRAGRH